MLAHWLNKAVLAIVVSNQCIVFLDCMWDYKREIKGAGTSNATGLVEWIGIPMSFHNEDHCSLHLLNAFVF